MRCDDLRARAAGLAALPLDDPDRREAEAHAATCADCAAALAAGGRLLALLDQLPAPPPPSPEVLRRVARAVSREEQRGRVAVPAAVVLGWLGLTLLDPAHHASGPHPWMSSIMLAVLGVAGLLLCKRRAIWMSVLLSAVAAILLAGAGPVVPSLGVRCLLLELGTALLPLAAVVVWVREGGISLHAAAAAAGALAAQGALHLSCPSSHARAHVLLFHTTGVLLAGALAALASRLLRRPSPG